MNAQPCLPEDIIGLNRHKEYTLIATDLLESVLTDTRLNAQTTKLWQILFNKARYNPSLEIKISYSFLGKKLGKSTRTIARYIDSLQNSGYLIVRHNFDTNGGQRPSTIAVRVPEFSIEHIKKKKDRLTKNTLDNNKTCMLETKNDGASSDSAFQATRSHSTITLISEHAEPTNVLCETNQHTVKNNIEEQQFSARLDTLPESVTIIEIEQQDKSDMGGDDSNVVHKDINKKDINKNNNISVVSFFQEEQKKAVMQSEIKVLEKQLADGNKQLTTLKDHSQLYDQIKRNSQAEASLHLLRIALDKMNHDIEVKTNQQKTKSELSNDPHCMLNKTGQREISSFTFKRLANTLRTLGYGGNDLNALINEIIFEARFGSLTNCNKTKNPLSLDKAINIGLKLVRENRWSTPELLKQYANY